MESDLKTLSDINSIFKYAENTNLLVPEKKRMLSYLQNLKTYLKEHSGAF